MNSNPTIKRLEPGQSGHDAQGVKPNYNHKRAGRIGGLLPGKRCRLCGQQGHRSQTCHKHRP